MKSAVVVMLFLTCSSLCITNNLVAETIAAFEGGADTPLTLETIGGLPGPKIVAAGGNPGGMLVLTEAINGQHNWATFDGSDPGRHSLSTFSFQFTMAPTSALSADGFSFSYADTAIFGTSGLIGEPPFTAEDPAATGILGIGFDTWNNTTFDFDDPSLPGGSNYHEVSIFYNGALVSRIDDTRLLPVPLTLDDGQWHQVNGSVNFADGAVNLAVDGSPIFNQLAIPGLVPFESRIMFAGRTGNVNQLTAIDNVRVQFVTCDLSGDGVCNVADINALGGLGDFTSGLSRFREIATSSTLEVGEVDSFAVDALASTPFRTWIEPVTQGLDDVRLGWFEDGVLVDSIRLQDDEIFDDEIALTGFAGVDNQIEIKLTAGPDADFNGFILQGRGEQPHRMTGDYELFVELDRAAFDLDHNGTIDLQDLDVWLAQAAIANGFSNPYPQGDSNLDGTVNLADFNQLKQSFGQESDWAGGDFNLDGVSDLADFNILKVNFGSSAAGVPEPTTLLLLALGFTSISLFRQRRLRL